MDLGQNVSEQITLGWIICVGHRSEYMQNLRRPLQKYDLRKVTSQGKNLSEEEHLMTHSVLSKYKLLFNGILVTWKNKPVDIELQQYVNMYHAKPYPVPSSHKKFPRKKCGGFYN